MYYFIRDDLVFWRAQPEGIPLAPVASIGKQVPLPSSQNLEPFSQEGAGSLWQTDTV